MSSDIRLSLYQTVLSMADLHKISVSRLQPALDADFLLLKKNLGD